MAEGRAEALVEAQADASRRAHESAGETEWRRQLDELRRQYETTEAAKRGRLEVAALALAREVSGIEADAAAAPCDRLYVYTRHHRTVFVDTFGHKFTPRVLLRGRRHLRVLQHQVVDGHPSLCAKTVDSHAPLQATAVQSRLPA